jgi:hypothetical protein
VAVVGDEDASVSRNLQAVRFALILGYKIEFARRRNAKDPAVRNIDDVETALPIERGTLDEGINRNATSIDDGPGIVGILTPEFIR